MFENEGGHTFFDETSTFRKVQHSSKKVWHPPIFEHSILPPGTKEDNLYTSFSARRAGHSIDRFGDYVNLMVHLCVLEGLGIRASDGAQRERDASADGIHSPGNHIKRQLNKETNT